MKKAYLLFASLIVFLFFACSESGSPPEDSSGVTELALRQTATGAISSVGEVDWYRYRAVDAQSILHVKCTSNTYRSDVELLVTVFETDENGNKVRLMADHAQVGSEDAANLNLFTYIDSPKDLYVSVRDLMDDKAASNQYYLSLNVVDSSDENEAFDQAVTLTVDNPDPNTFPSDVIGYRGDTDNYTFTANSTGVYDVQIEFDRAQGRSEVSLSADLYDNNGEMIGSLSPNGGISSYNLRIHLEQNSYYVRVYDNGMNNADTLSPYTIHVDQLEVEGKENDFDDDAVSLGNADTEQTTTGSIDYEGDQDWYAFSFTSAALNVINLTFTATQSADFNYDVRIVRIEGAQEETLLTHRHNGRSAIPYTTQIKAGSGNHYLVIAPANGQGVNVSSPYSASIQVMGCDDINETGDTGNNFANPVTLAPDTTPLNTFISFRGDEDWYQIDGIAASDATPQVLELTLAYDQGSAVDFLLAVYNNDGNILKRVYDTNSLNGWSSLKTSLLVTNTNNLILKICDYQGDEGDFENPYQLTASWQSIQATVPNDPDGGTPTYFSETIETNLPEIEREDITLQYNTNDRSWGSFKANATYLDFKNDPGSKGITITANGDGTTDIEFPWMAGYVDYQGDIDFYQIDLGQPMDTASDWYYDIKVEMQVNSDVEYICQFFRDSDNNKTIVDHLGEVASNAFAIFGDESPSDTSSSSVDTSTMGSFWAGVRWINPSPANGANYYIAIRDLNYLQYPNGTYWPEYDDDWGYSSPYYFKLTLTYHPCYADPEDTDPAENCP